MQIMPETGEWLAGKFGEAADYAPDRLFDANTNLRYGCWYLGYLLATFSAAIWSKWRRAITPGRDRVARWLEDRSISPDGHTLPVDKIPFADTKQYVERVVKAHAIYQKRYWSEKAALAYFCSSFRSCCPCAARRRRFPRCPRICA